ncbi:hypothetical protein ABE07_23910 [Bacillus thuringiensis]|nr:Hypothetical protein NF53_p6242 [Bacillus thuringiensis serovar indiana]MBG9645737.1 hypothetical protein [Bacillus thuringiensis]MBG9653049.1 hypothetical protein [Bacillus thuringiensis]MEB9620078.1 hypothetical protein [Bacillus cereus]MEB9649834.1 hypothetical protein [Bacillus cereus]
MSFYSTNVQGQESLNFHFDVFVITFVVCIVPTGPVIPVGKVIPGSGEKIAPINLGSIKHLGLDDFPNRFKSTPPFFQDSLNIK